MLFPNTTYKSINKYMHNNISNIFEIRFHHQQQIVSTTNNNKLFPTTTQNQHNPYFQQLQGQPLALLIQPITTNCHFIHNWNKYLFFLYFQQPTTWKCSLVFSNKMTHQPNTISNNPSRLSCWSFPFVLSFHSLDTIFHSWYQRSCWPRWCFLNDHSWWLGRFWNDHC